jgi:hypothetical protein
VGCGRSCSIALRCWRDIYHRAPPSPRSAHGAAALTNVSFERSAPQRAHFNARRRLRTLVGAACGVPAQTSEAAAAPQAMVEGC